MLVKSNHKKPATNPKEPKGLGVGKNRMGLVMSIDECGSKEGVGKHTRLDVYLHCKESNNTVSSLQSIKSTHNVNA